MSAQPARAEKAVSSDPDVVAVKAVARVFRAWRVNASVAAKLCAVSERTWSRMRTGDWNGSLSQDQRMRVSAIIGLYKGLHLYFGEDLADRWVKLPNRGPVFAGWAPIDCLQEGGLPTMISARDYIDAVRGGM